MPAAVTTVTVVVTDDNGWRGRSEDAMFELHDLHGAVDLGAIVFTWRGGWQD